jgi:hypothetical protein
MLFSVEGPSNTYDGLGMAVFDIVKAAAILPHAGNNEIRLVKLRPRNIYIPSGEDLVVPYSVGNNRLD